MTLRDFCFVAGVAFGMVLRAGSPLTWESGSGFRHAALPVPKSGRTGFSLLNPGELGIHFTNHLSMERVMQHQNLMNGAGIACGDVDEDGLVDLYFCNKQGANALFRNLGGGRFTNITAQAGVACATMTSVGAVLADINADGHLDLIVSTFGGPNACFLGDGKGRFRDFTTESGLSGSSAGTSLAMGDLNGDGHLDLYWCNYALNALLRDTTDVTERIIAGVPTITGRWATRLRIMDGKYVEFGEPDSVFINDGRGRFTALDWKTHFRNEHGEPVEAPMDFSQSVQIRDVNQDGHPDIYVCSDYQTPDRIWLGDGKGHFRAQHPFATRVVSHAATGVDFADIDRDGRLDFLVVEKLGRDFPQHLRAASSLGPRQRVPGTGDPVEAVDRNTLFHGRGDGTWEEIACFAGVAATGWSWAPLFLDVDLDGFEDILVSNGHLHDMTDRDLYLKAGRRGPRPGRGTSELLSAAPTLIPPKLAYHNRHNLTFVETGVAWGFNSTRIAQGMVAADIDGDGDLDVILNCMEGPPLVYRNDSSAPRVMVRLKGLPGNHLGIGASIQLSGGPVEQTQEMILGGQYLSCSEPVRVFAAGDKPMRLTVTWRSGRRSIVQGVLANHVYEMDEAGAAPSPSSPPRPAPALFEDWTRHLNHAHAESAFDDFTAQPLAPRRFGQNGPGIAVGELDGGDHDDIAVASGAGGGVALFRGDGGGNFEVISTGLGQPLQDDTGAMVRLPRMRGGTTLFASLAGYESDRKGSPSILSWDGVRGNWKPGASLGSLLGSAGPLALGDMDGSGKLVLFAGSRFMPGRYPEAGRSALFLEANGHWAVDPESSPVFAEAGMVSAATWADLDNDGLPELILACDWGPIRVFQRREGKWLEITQPLGLSEHVGWWNSVVVGDFDGDGRLDLAAGNWGLNSRWQIWSEEAPGLLHGAVEGNGVVQVVELTSDRESRQWRPWRDHTMLTSGFPSLAAGFSGHRAYSTSSIEQVLGPTRPNLKELKATTLATHVFLNRGNRFEAHPLPAEAQLAPVFGLVVADFDGDGHEDLFLAQNFFATRPEDERLGAGQGLLLRGDGKGGFIAMRAPASGIRIWGEQRGAATGDLDGDGRPDLVVAQNGAETTVWHNVMGRPGLRVRLVGPKGNRNGFGAVVRLRFGARLGPARVVSGGGGYWSQDSSTLVMAQPEPATGIEVRWPGGRLTTGDLPPDIREVLVGGDGVMLK